MIKRLALKLTLSIVALALIAGILTIILRDPSAGGYRFATRSAYQVPDVPGELAIVPKILPVVRLYGHGGDSPHSVLLLPLVKIGVGLNWGAPVLRYDIMDDGTMTLQTFSSPEPTLYLSSLSEEETARQFEAWQGAHEQRVRELHELTSTPANESGWVSHLGSGPAMLVIPANYVHRAGKLVMLGDRKDSYMTFEAARGRPVPDLDRQFHRRFNDYARTDDDVFIAKQADGRFVIDALRDVGNETWVMTGNASDFEAAVQHVAIIRSLHEDGQLWSIAGETGNYLHSSVLEQFPDYQDQANEAFIRWISNTMEPETVVLDSTLMKWRLPFEVKNDAGAKLYSQFEIRLSLSAQDGKLKAENAELLAESDDQRIQVGTLPGSNYAPSLCLVEGTFPLLPAEGDSQLGVEISMESASLPDCQLAAQILVDFGESNIADKLDMKDIAPLGDYFGQFTFATLDDDGFMILQRGKASAVIRRTGEGVIPLTEETRFSFLNEDTLIGTSSAPDRPGVTLYDLSGKTIAELDYDNLSPTISPDGVWPDVFQSLKDEKYGLFDVKQGLEIAPARYDRLRIIPDWDLVIASRGDNDDILTRNGEHVIESGVSDYIFADPTRELAPEDDFLAVQRISDGNWQFLTKTQLPLLDGTFANVKQVPSANGRAFELTMLDGTRRYISVTREGRVEAIPAPE